MNIEDKIHLIRVSGLGSYFNQYPIHAIIQYGDVDLLAHYLAQNYDINEVDSRYKTPIEIAFIHKRTTMIDMLLADPRLYFNPYKTSDAPFVLAIKHEIDLNIVKRIATYSTPNADHINNGLSYACMNWNTKAEVVEYLLSLGAEVNSESIVTTPLFIAAYRNNLICTEILLKHGANPNWVNQDNDTILHEISTSYDDDGKMIKMIKLMLDHGADRTLKNNLGLTPAEYAESKGHIKNAAFLREYLELPDIKEPADEYRI